MPLHAVAKLGHAFLVSAMGATEDASVSLYTVSDNPAPAMPAGGCKRVDGAFETVEDVRRTLGSNFESLVVVISANFTDRHHYLLLSLEYGLSERSRKRLRKGGAADEPQGRGHCA
jgi:hypothetical protein